MPWQCCLSSWVQARFFCRGHLELTGKSTPFLVTEMPWRKVVYCVILLVVCQHFWIPVFQSSTCHLSCYWHSLVDAFHTFIWSCSLIAQLSSVAFRLLMHIHLNLWAPNIAGCWFTLFFFSNVGMFPFIIYFKQWATSAVSWKALPGDRWHWDRDLWCWTKKSSWLRHRAPLSGGSRSFLSSVCKYCCCFIANVIAE